MSDETVLVLGASRYQLEVIEKARALGYRVATTDNVPDNPGHALADARFDVDTTDVPRVVALAREIGPVGVIAACTDVAVVTAARVSEALGLPGPPPASAEVLTSKVAFRRFLAEASLPTPPFFSLDAETWDGRAPPGLALSSPCIVKPEGSSGSKGAFIVRTEAELASRAPASFGFSPVRRAIVESFVAGRQGTCEGVVRGGEIALAVVTDRETASPPYVATVGHRVPSRLSARERAAVVGAISGVLELLAVRTSPFDCDFVVGDDGEVYLLELTPRLGGNSLTELVRASTGVDLAEIAVSFACGREVGDLSSVTERPAAQLVLGVPRAGALAFDERELALLRAEPWVRQLSLDVPRGHAVEAFVNGRERVGEASIVAESRDAVDARVGELRARLALGVAP
jgi:biotin carboxylase